MCDSSICTPRSIKFITKPTNAKTLRYVKGYRETESFLKNNTFLLNLINGRNQKLNADPE